MRRARMVPRGDGLRIVHIGRPRRHGDFYARLLDARWRQLLIGSTLLYLLTNVVFACIFLLIGNGIENARPGSFADAFFFSVQTMATIGYGKMAPSGIAANLVVTVEALAGFGFFALVTGLAFAKFSRPTARVMFSAQAVICPYEGVPHLMIRLANERGNRIVDARAEIFMLRREVTREGIKMRRFYDLPPVRSHVPVMQLSWTLMHAIDENSPLFKLDCDGMREQEAEIIVSLTGVDETLSQTIYSRYSYVADEIVMNAAFADILRPTEDGRLEVHYHRFNEIIPFQTKNCGPGGPC